MKRRPCTGIGVVGLDPTAQEALRCRSASPSRRGSKLLLVELLGCLDAMRPLAVRRLAGVLLGLGLLSGMGGRAGCEAATVKIGERWEGGMPLVLGI